MSFIEGEVIGPYSPGFVHGLNTARYNLPGSELFARRLIDEGIDTARVLMNSAMGPVEEQMTRTGSDAFQAESAKLKKTAHLLSMLVALPGYDGSPPRPITPNDWRVVLECQARYTEAPQPYRPELSISDLCKIVRERANGSNRRPGKVRLGWFRPSAL